MDAPAVLASLERLGSARIRDDMRNRYGVTCPTAETAFGVPMAAMLKLAKRIGKDHALALELWATTGKGTYEARMVACMIDDPALVTAKQMDEWCLGAGPGNVGFDNWGITDTVCFKLFDQVSPDLAFRKAGQWVKHKDEFVKRAGFALLACLALHNRDADLDGRFAGSLALIERGSSDGRNFVKKGIIWAVRAIAGRGPALNNACLDLARRLGTAGDPASRWIGKECMKFLAGPAGHAERAGKGRAPHPDHRPSTASRTSSR